MNKYDLAIEEYKRGKSIKNICKELHLTYKLLKSRLILNGIEIRGKSSTTKVLSDEVKNNIISMYNNGKSIREINRITNVNRIDISTLLKQNNLIVNKRKYTLNESIFESIDSEEKAYWLGFLCADGSVCDGVLDLTLKESDREHIVKFNKFLESDSEIKTYKRKCKISTNPDKELIYYGVKVASKKLCNDLIKQGCVPRKSLILKFPHHLNNELKIHFIRGIFDGDGCVHIDTSKTPSITFIVNGAYDLIDGINKFLNINGNLRKEGKIYRLQCKGNIKAMRIFDLMYDNATVFLDRKYHIYRQFKCRLNSNPLKS